MKKIKKTNKRQKQKKIVHIKPLNILNKEEMDKIYGGNDINIMCVPGSEIPGVNIGNKSIAVCTSGNQVLSTCNNFGNGQPSNMKDCTNDPWLVSYCLACSHSFHIGCDPLGVGWGF